jgi:hypothetical protein
MHAAPVCEIGYFDLRTLSSTRFGQVGSAFEIRIRWPRIVTWTWLRDRQNRQSKPVPSEQYADPPAHQEVAPDHNAEENEQILAPQNRVAQRCFCDTLVQVTNVSKFGGLVRWRNTSRNTSGSILLKRASKLSLLTLYRTGVQFPVCLPQNTSQAVNPFSILCLTCSVFKVKGGKIG